MKAANDNWVKVKIIKHMISLYGSHFPGAIVTVPEHVAKNWVENGIAEWSEEPMTTIVPRTMDFGTFEVAEETEAEVSGDGVGEALPEVDESNPEQPHDRDIDRIAEQIVDKIRQKTGESDSPVTVVEEAPVQAEVVKPKKSKRVRKSRKK